MHDADDIAGVPTADLQILERPIHSIDSIPVGPSGWHVGTWHNSQTETWP